MTDTVYTLVGLFFLYACFRVGGISLRLYKQGHRALPLLAVYIIFSLVTHLP